jgi:hypothetical protein
MGTVFHNAGLFAESAKSVQHSFCEIKGQKLFGRCRRVCGPPLWSSGQSSWLQIRRPGFDSRHYQKNLMGLERGPLSLVSTKELLDRKVAAPV